MVGQVRGRQIGIKFSGFAAVLSQLCFMKKQVLFIQGGGEDGYAADATMVESLRAALGRRYVVNYREMRSDESRVDFGWPEQIGKEITKCGDNVIIVAHSLGASLLLKYLSESPPPHHIRAIFLLATAFWQGTEDWVKGLMLKEGFAADLPTDTPISMYHCKDDPEVPFDHLALYKQSLPGAHFHEFEKGGHLFREGLGFLRKEIVKLH